MKNLDLIRPKRLCEILDIHISTLYRWMEEDKLPIEKVKFGPRAVGFRRKDVEAWLNGDLIEQTENSEAANRVTQ